MQFDTVGIRVVDRRADVDADHAHRAQPTDAQACADAWPVVGAGERIARVDESSHAPSTGEVVLHLRAGDQQVAPANHAAGAVARADRLEAVATHGAVATGKEAQLRWQRGEVAGAGDAGAAAQDQPVAAAFAEGANPFGVGGELAEAGIGKQRAHGAARGQVDRPAVPHEGGVVGLLARQRRLAEHQRAAAVVDAGGVVRLVAALAHGERARQRMYAEGAHPAVPLPRLVAHQLQRARLRGGGVGIAEIGAEVVAALVGAGQGDGIQGGQRFQPLRHHQFVLPLVTAPVDPATLHAAAHAEARVGADERAAGVDRALGRHKLHGDIDHAGMGFVHIGQHVDHREIIGTVQRLLQCQQFVLFEIIAGFERHVAVQKAFVELRALEAHLAVAVARARLPGQLDHRAAIRTAHLHAMGEQACVEEALGGQFRREVIARCVVHAVVQHLALQSFDHAPRAADRTDARSGFIQLQFHRRDFHRLARLHVQRHQPVVAARQEIAGDGGIVITVRLQRGAHLLRRALHQSPHLRIADVARGVLRKIHRRHHRVAQGIVHAIDDQLHVCLCQQRHQPQRQQETQASEHSAHPRWQPSGT